MHFTVKILEIDEEPRGSTLLATYDVEAAELDEARIMGLVRFKQEHPGRSLSLIHGKAMEA